MTPKKAVISECRKCMNTTIFKGCSSEICKLNNTALTYSKRIKAHCLDCIPEHSAFGVKACDGELLDGSICVLHPFRLGKSPRRVAAGLKSRALEGISGVKFQSKGKGMAKSTPEREWMTILPIKTQKPILHNLGIKV